MVVIVNAGFFLGRNVVYLEGGALKKHCVYVNVNLTSTVFCMAHQCCLVQIPTHLPINGKNNVHLLNGVS